MIALRCKNDKISLVEWLQKINRGSYMQQS